MVAVHKLDRPYAGSFTVRVAAQFLRATTPRPDKPVRLWSPRRAEFVATSRAVYAWIRLGMEWDAPLPVNSRERVITFEDLVRLRMIALLRARGIPYSTIRRAEAFARDLTGLPQPFVTEQVWSDESDIFLAIQDLLVALNRHGQLALPTLREYLRPAHHGLRFDRNGIATEWSPHTGVTIDPEIQFGSPCISGTRIETEAVWAFHQAGDSVALLAKMYRIGPDQVESALDWDHVVSLAA